VVGCCSFTMSVNLAANVKYGISASYSSKRCSGYVDDLYLSVDRRRLNIKGLGSRQLGVHGSSVQFIRGPRMFS
jgi:hypothetical protein